MRFCSAIPMPEKKLILVTGGAGFIGSHLCERLVADGHRVISLDNYFTGSKENHVAGVEYREGHTKDIEMHIPETPDLVFHLGEYSRVEVSFSEPSLVWDLNVAGTFGVLEFCRKKNVKLVYAGSSTKFGDEGAGKDQSPYAWTKANNTELVKNYGEWFGLKYAITYFYNVYGPREITSGMYATVIGIFREEFKHGQPITVVAPGTQRRNFTHVSDIVAALAKVGEQGIGDGYAIGNEKSFSILEVGRLFGSELVMLPERKGNRLTSTLDTSKTRLLGWDAKVSLEDELHTFIQEFKGAVKHDGRVLVFTTTFHPISGPAEDALLELMRTMPSVQFDIITSAYSEAAKTSKSPLPNVSIYRVGSGKKSDKYMLPVLAYREAIRLTKIHTYAFAWSIMASYATVAAVRLKRSSKLPLLVTLADQPIESYAWYVRPFLRYLLRQADQVYASNALQERSAALVASRSALRSSIGAGDAFANQLRFVYNEIFSNTQKLTK